jgi:FAD/FMN-containing dehydrogenase
LTAWATVPDLQAAVKLLGLAQRQLGAGLTGFEVMSQFSLSLVAKHLTQLNVPPHTQSPWCVLLELSDNESEAHAHLALEALLGTAMEADVVSDAVIAQNLSQAQALWQVRESISMAQSQEGLNIKHDISLPISGIPAFVAETDALLQREISGVRLVNFGHLGDGNLHYNVQAPEGGDSRLFLQMQEESVNTLVFDQVRKHHGSISAEHGIGTLKAATLHRYKDPAALAMMRAIKQALDPQNILNPGKVLT